MSTHRFSTLAPLPLSKVKLEGGFWGARQELNRAVTLPIEYEQLKGTGRIDAFKLGWRPGQPNPPHQFWDSDVAKWIEAVGYSLATHPDPALERLADEVIALIVGAQQPDGYLNVHFTVVEPQNRWKNLRDMHELYCAGHLMEAAVAYYQGTGKRTLLDALCRYADHIATVFGPGEGQKRGYPGHPEIELALVKLYRATGVERYLRLAQFFVEERGRQPHYYDLEAAARGETEKPRWMLGGYSYNQSHLPIRQQTTAEGHAVRAMYLFSGATDVAAETGDAELLAVMEGLWRNVTLRRMYLTGGIGSGAAGERFTYDYDLPNDLAYAETCAAIGLVFWAQRLLHCTGDATYADIMERALYNGVLSGLSLDGRRFFYANPLEMNPAALAGRPDLFHPIVQAQRQEWFGCACCPPNIARLLASLGAYLYGQSEDTLYVHLFTPGQAEFTLGGQAVILRQETDYPWGELVRLTVHPARPATFTLALRLPGWCRGARLTVAGTPQDVQPLLRRGYIHLARRWQPGDVVEWTLPMPIECVYAHPAVRADAGRVALQRGPLVYCLEEADNGPLLHDLALPREAELRATWEPELLGGVVTLSGRALRRDPAGWENALYRPNVHATRAVAIKAIPYYAWANRGAGEMLVWLREACP